MPGNQFGDKLSEEQKQEAYQQYCQWISEGKSKESWHFEHPELSLTWETMEAYMQKDSKAFASIHMKEAKSKSLEHWESLGKKMMLGHIEGKVQPAIYQMFMRNKFNWDKPIRNTDEATQILIDIVNYAKHKEENGCSVQANTPE